jgi:hypothetical protein
VVSWLQFVLFESFYCSFHPFFFFGVRSFHLQAWADFLKDQNLDEAKLLKSYQIVPRVAPSPTFRKGLYAGGGELGAIQAPTLLENYLVGRLEAPTFAATTVVWAAPLLRNNEVYRDWCGRESGGASVEGMYKGMKWVGGRGGRVRQESV